MIQVGEISVMMGLPVVLILLLASSQYCIRLHPDRATASVIDRPINNDMPECFLRSIIDPTGRLVLYLQSICYIRLGSTAKRDQYATFEVAKLISYGYGDFGLKEI